MATRKLTPELLRKIVLEEKNKMLREAAAVGSDPVASGKAHAEDLTVPEVDADGYADTLAHEIDHMKALKIHEQRLTAKLREIQEAKKRLRERVSKKLG
jgi:hypothetical protein